MAQPAFGSYEEAIQLRIAAIDRKYAGKLGKANVVPMPRAKLPSMYCVMLAVSMIREMRKADAARNGRKIDAADGYPDDLGCETQIYLGSAVRAEFPKLKVIEVAACCMVHPEKAYFFAELLDLAEAANWVKPKIRAAARAALVGGK